ncbi:MAG TPA: hypothetical protein VGN23_16045 [Verrucomicrobiae bacterium]|jgi:hypothetical protein
MAYDLHIECAERILLADWKAAISAADGVRLVATQAHTVTNPKTGEVIGIPMHEGDAEVFFATDKKWYPVFCWRDGSAVFAARFQSGDRSHPVWVAAASLAKHLAAVIRGDNGEIYDLDTGKVTHA